MLQNNFGRPLEDIKEKLLFMKYVETIMEEKSLISPFKCCDSENNMTLYIYMHNAAKKMGYNWNIQQDLLHVHKKLSWKNIDKIWLYLYLYLEFKFE